MADLYAVHTEIPPGNRFYHREDINDFKWDDAAWMERKEEADPVNVPDGNLRGPSRFLAQERPVHRRRLLYILEAAPRAGPDYVKKMGYTPRRTHGIAEHPYDGSRGKGYRLLRSDFPLWPPLKRVHVNFVNYLHKKVDRYHPLTEFRPTSPKGCHRTCRLHDGQPLYEYADPRKGEHPDWGPQRSSIKAKNEVKTS